MSRLRRVALTLNEVALVVAIAAILVVAMVVVALVGLAGFVTDLVRGPAKPKWSLA